MTDPYQLKHPIICTYDSNHSIAASRIQKNLVKYAKVSCSCNVNQRLFKSEFQEHISTCPDQQHLDPVMYEQYHKRGGTMSVQSLDGKSTIDLHESWDKEQIDLCLIPRTAEACCQYRTEYTILNTDVRFNSEESISHTTSVVQELPLLRANVRTPSELAEALMMEQSGESMAEDMESVASFMGVGRGKPWTVPRPEIIMKVGRGRGPAQINNIL